MQAKNSAANKKAKARTKSIFFMRNSFSGDGKEPFNPIPHSIKFLLICQVAVLGGGLVYEQPASAFSVVGGWQEKEFNRRQIEKTLDNFINYLRGRVSDLDEGVKTARAIVVNILGKKFYPARKLGDNLFKTKEKTQLALGQSIGLRNRLKVLTEKELDKELGEINKIITEVNLDDIIKEGKRLADKYPSRGDSINELLDQVSDTKAQLIDYFNQFSQIIAGKFTGAYIPPSLPDSTIETPEVGLPCSTVDQKAAVKEIRPVLEDLYYRSNFQYASKEDIRKFIIAALKYDSAQAGKERRASIAKKAFEDIFKERLGE